MLGANPALYMYMSGPGFASIVEIETLPAHELIGFMPLAGDQDDVARRVAGPHLDRIEREAPEALPEARFVEGDLVVRVQQVSADQAGHSCADDG